MPDPVPVSPVFRGKSAAILDAVLVALGASLILPIALVLIRLDPDGLHRTVGAVSATWFNLAVFNLMLIFHPIGAAVASVWLASIALTIWWLDGNRLRLVLTVLLLLWFANGIFWWHIGAAQGLTMP